MPAVSLVCHPATPCSFVRGFTVHVDAIGEHALTLRYRVEGDVDRLLVPEARRPGHADGLWRHTCFEAFVKRRDSRAYVEINASPSTEWAVYGFDDYRDGMRPLAPREAPEIVCRRNGAALEIGVSVSLASLFAERVPASELRFALAAVLEERAGPLSYWALVHPAARPDFHRAESFAASLAEPGVGA